MKAKYIIFIVAFLIIGGLSAYSISKKIEYHREQVDFLKEMIEAQDELILESDYIIRENNITSERYQYLYNRVDSLWNETL